MPQLPPSFPPLPPSSLRLRCFELYRSSVFVVLVKSDKSFNITFEFYDVTESGRAYADVEEHSTVGSIEKVDIPSLSKKIGYILSTMTSVRPFNIVEPSSDAGHAMEYPAFKGIFLAEEYRCRKVDTKRDHGGGEQPRYAMSQLMMNIYYKFLAYLYRVYCRSNTIPALIGDVECAKKDGTNLLNIDHKEHSHSNMGLVAASHPQFIFYTHCVMRKVLVCKLLSSHHWKPIKSSKRLEVVVLPRTHHNTASHVTSANQRHTDDCRDATSPALVGKDKGIQSTKITSQVLSLRVMQSKLFTPRTCQSQNIELLSWEDAVAQVGLHEHADDTLKSPSETETYEYLIAAKIGSRVMVNCEYALHVEDLLALVYDYNADDGEFSFAE